MPTLYYALLSAPCRSILLTAKALEVHLNLKAINIMEGDTRTPEFLKMNIQHTVPTLDDDGFYLNESRAVLQYLANKYAKGDKKELYPTDPVARAKVDMKLCFDMGTLYARFAEAYYPAIFAKQPVSKEKVEKLDEALGYLDHYLKEGYVAGSSLTIADFAILASLSTIEATGHDISRFLRVKEYLEKCKQEVDGYYELNQSGADQFGAFAKPALTC